MSTERVTQNYKTVFSCLLGLCVFLTANGRSGRDFSSTLPIIVINTQNKEILDEKKSIGHMGVIYKGRGKRNLITDNFNEYDGYIGIEIRGSSSQMFPKKQYAVETRDEDGDNLNVPLLGFLEENDWILYAPYSDKSLIRNCLAYKLYRETGRYTSRTRFCELFLNGDYKGLYVFMEKIKRDKNRIDISKLNANETAGDDLTGGYIIKIDKWDGENNDGWESLFSPYAEAWQSVFYQYHYPKANKITVAQKDYIERLIHDFESVMNEDNYNDPEQGYQSRINMGSFVDHILISEVARNVDAYRLSTFLYKDKDSNDPKVYAGPIWDYNLAFGNANYYKGAYDDGWHIEYEINEDDFWQPPFWWQQIWADTSFQISFTQRWRELRENSLSTENIEALIDSMVQEIEEAQERNFERWPVLGTYVWPNARVYNKYGDEIGYLKDWIKARLDWIDNNLIIEDSTISIQKDDGLPRSIFLSNYPNPFNETTTITYSLSQRDRSIISVYDLNGRLIKQYSEEYEDAGSHTVVWNGKDSSERKVSTGIYLIMVRSGDISQSAKMLLLR